MEISQCWRCLRNMFFHLADKIYVVNSLSKPAQSPDINQYSYDNLNEMSLYPTFSHYVKSLIDRYVHNRKVTILIVSEKDFETLMSVYCSRLSLGEDGFNYILSYNNFCENNIEDFCSTISIPSSFAPVFTKSKNEKIYYPWLFPAELCINQIDTDEWARDKYEYFRMYELYARIKDAQFDLVRNNVVIDFDIGHDDQKIKTLYTNKSFIQTVSQYVDTEFLRIALMEYIASNPTYGYNRFNAWKFNYYLADYVKRTGYRIGERYAQN